MRKKALILSLLTSAALLMSSCGTSDVIPVRESVIISFSWWGKDLRNNYTISAMKKFGKLNDNIDVLTDFSELEPAQNRMFVQYAANNEADVMQIYYEWLYRLSPDGEGFYDLNTLADIIDLETFSKEELSYGTVNGKLLGLPISLNAETFYYNKGIYDSYGLDLPSKWSDLFKAAEVMSKDNVYPLEMDKTSAWLACVAHQEQITGKHCYNAYSELSFTENDYRQMLEFYKELVDKKVIKHFAETDKNDFLNGVSAGALYWISNAGYYGQPLINRGYNIVIGDYVREPGSLISGWHAKPTALYSIKKNTKHPEEAAKLVDFLVNSQEMALLQGTEKGIPLSRAMLEVLESNKTLVGIQYEANNKLSSSNEIDRINPNLEDPDLLEEFNNAVALMIYDGKQPEELAESLYRTAKESNLRYAEN